MRRDERGLKSRKTFAGVCGDWPAVVAAKGQEKGKMFSGRPRTWAARTRALELQAAAVTHKLRKSGRLKDRENLSAVGDTATMTA